MALSAALVEPSRCCTLGGSRRFHFDTGGSEPAVLFLHGIPSHHVIWREVIAALRPEIRAVALDLTGFGFSDLPENADLSPDGQADGLLEFVDALELERFTIVAHDFGALVACAMLDRSPEHVSGLVLTNTSLRHGDWSGSWPNPFRLVRLPLVGELAFAVARPFMLRWAYAVYVEERGKLEGALMDELWEPFEHGFARTLLRLFRGDGSSPEAFEHWRAALRDFDGPAMVAWGAQDPTFRLDRAVDIAGLLPQAESVVLEHANHFVQIDRPRVLARHINRFVLGSA